MTQYVNIYLNLSNHIKRDAICNPVTTKTTHITLMSVLVESAHMKYAHVGIFVNRAKAFIIQT